MYGYIERRSPSGAMRWREAFEMAIAATAKQPEVGGIAPENPLTRWELRQKLFKTKHGLTYRFVYTVMRDELLVLRLRGPGQPPLRADEVPIE